MNYEYKIEDTDLKSDALALDLTQETEPKPEPAARPAEYGIEAEPRQPAACDFSPPAGGREQIPGFEDSQENDEPHSPADFEAQAKLYIAFADGVQSLTLPYFYQQQNFTPDELSRLEEIKTQPEPDKPEDKAIKEKSAAFAEYCDKLPFSSKEEKLLLGPLTKVLQKYNHAPGPETALIMAALTVAAPRVLPLFKFGK